VAAPFWVDGVMEVYFVVQLRIGGTYAEYREYLSHCDLDYPPYSGRAIPAKWFRTDHKELAERFETPGKARGIAKRLKMVKEIVQHGGAWAVLRVTEEVVEASDESPLKRLASVAK
jgi:hypothetical protein